MKKGILVLALLSSFSALAGTNLVCYIENKGQIVDQEKKPRSDIQFSMHNRGMAIFVGKMQMHYQFIAVAQEKAVSGQAASQRQFATYADENVKTYRVDMELSGADRNAEVIAADKVNYYEN